MSGQRSLCGIFTIDARQHVPPRMQFLKFEQADGQSHSALSAVFLVAFDFLAGHTHERAVQPFQTMTKAWTSF